MPLLILSSLAIYLSLITTVRRKAGGRVDPMGTYHIPPHTLHPFLRLMVHPPEVQSTSFVFRVHIVRISVLLSFETTVNSDKGHTLR